MSGPNDNKGFLPATRMYREALDLEHRRAQKDTVRGKVEKDPAHPYHLVEGKSSALGINSLTSNLGAGIILRRIGANEANVLLSRFLQKLKADIGWNDDRVLESTRMEFGQLLAPLIVALLAECVGDPSACGQTVRESLVRTIVLKAQEVLEDAVLKQEKEVQQGFLAFKFAFQEAGKLISEGLSKVDQLPDEMGPVLIDLTTMISPVESENDEEKAEEEFVEKLMRTSGITSSRPLMEEQAIDPWRPDRVDEAVASIQDELQTALQDDPFGNAAIRAQWVLEDIKRQAASLKEACRRLGNCKIVRTNAQDTVCLTARLMATENLWDVEEKAMKCYKSRVLGATDTDGYRKQKGTIDPRRLMS